MDSSISKGKTPGSMPPDRTVSSVPARPRGLRCQVCDASGRGITPHPATTQQFWVVPHTYHLQ